MTKTLFVYALSSALAISAVFCRSSQAAQITYEESELQALEDQTTVVAGVALDREANGDTRTANLKFVLAIQRSAMWTDIKHRTVMISTSPSLAALLDADPYSLSDSDLELLKKACHDGFKCVAVDQLLVLRSVTKTLPNGLVAVRKEITKITHVLSNYTTEYYEDTYQYEEVSESESDPSKLDETVTVIVEDNKELCGIRLGHDMALVEDETMSTTVTRDANSVVEWTVSVGLDGSGDAAAKKTTPAAEAILLADYNEKEEYDDDDADEDDSFKSRAKVRVPSKNRDHGDQLDREARAGGQAYRANDSAKRDAVAPTTVKIPSSDQYRDDDYEGPGPKQSVSIANVTEDDSGNSGDSLTKADVVSAGDNNASTVKKGYAEHGVINNGEMNQYNVNKGSINKGVVNRSNADGGIINVGTLNNGPTNYGTANDYANYGTVANMDDIDIKQYLSYIDQTYSSIIDKLDKQ